MNNFREANWAGKVGRGVKKGVGAEKKVARRYLKRGWGSSGARQARRRSGDTNAVVVTHRVGVGVVQGCLRFLMTEFNGYALVLQAPITQYATVGWRCVLGAKSCAGRPVICVPATWEHSPLCTVVTAAGSSACSRNARPPWFLAKGQKAGRSQTQTNQTPCFFWWHVD